MSKNTNLHAAKTAKNDEFYTQLTDIEKELKHYKEQFRDKVVYCNCDDARYSNFFKYFSLNFEHLGLKKLICTGYKESNLFTRQSGVVLIYEGDKNGNHIVDDEEIEVKYLEGDGDFRSDECVEFLKEADIVVSNPPFSLFREYMKQLFDYNKKFIILGNNNAITYKEIFPYIKNGKLWLGYSSNKTIEFQLSDDYEKWNDIRDGKKYGKVPAISWFTNLSTNKGDNPTPICKRYNSDDYPFYDNYNAIECGKISDFPIDVPIGGVVGVPITIVDKIASDGLIYFDDGGMSAEPQQYLVERFRKGNDGNDLTYAHTHRTSECLSDVSDSGCERTHECNEIKNENNNVGQGCGFCNQLQTNLCESSYQAFEVIGIQQRNDDPFKTKRYTKEQYTNANDLNARGVIIINGVPKSMFPRILIQRIK